MDDGPAQTSASKRLVMGGRGAKNKDRPKERKMDALLRNLTLISPFSIVQIPTCFFPMLSVSLVHFA